MCLCFFSLWWVLFFYYILIYLLGYSILSFICWCYIQKPCWLFLLVLRIFLCNILLFYDHNYFFLFIFSDVSYLFFLFNCIGQHCQYNVENLWWEWIFLSCFQIDVMLLNICHYVICLFRVSIDNLCWVSSIMDVNFYLMFSLYLLRLL